LNKSVVTNVIAAAIALIGYLLADAHVVMMTGLFALSGGVTNWLAVHMLFERVPFLYGSGVIPSRFAEFKTGIKTLIVQEFFSREHIVRFVTGSDAFGASNLADKIDTDHVFESLADAIEASPMGSMLGMIGGRAALEPLREPVGLKVKELVTEIASGEGGGQDAIVESIATQVETIIDARLAELTPEQVKEIVSDMIRKHLGWLVVWGGVFGGLIGLVVSVAQVG
jgi:uncharacterized membrane-anchored protein YjiN (DUF445 family)